MLLKLKQDLDRLKNPSKAKSLQRFFKTGKGEYGEGDIFLGISVAVQHQLVKKYHDLSLLDLQSLLNSKIHEQRLVTLLILVSKYKKAKPQAKKEIFNFYLGNTKNINNWDLVDLSAPKIVGDYLQNKNKLVLYKLAKSKNLWERRVAIMATFAFIRNNNFEEALKIGQLLLQDKHDLIHKAVGWMLREIGKRDQRVEEDFLQKYYRKMPRTMLRYAIEKFSRKKRDFYLKK